MSLDARLEALATETAPSPPTVDDLRARNRVRHRRDRQRRVVSIAIAAAVLLIGGLVLARRHETTDSERVTTATSSTLRPPARRLPAVTVAVADGTAIAIPALPRGWQLYRAPEAAPGRRGSLMTVGLEQGPVPPDNQIHMPRPQVSVALVTLPDGERVDPALLDPRTPLGSIRRASLATLTQVPLVPNDTLVRRGGRIVVWNPRVQVTPSGLPGLPASVSAEYVFALDARHIVEVNGGGLTAAPLAALQSIGDHILATEPVDATRCMAALSSDPVARDYLGGTSDDAIARAYARHDTLTTWGLDGSCVTDAGGARTGELDPHRIAVYLDGGHVVAAYRG